MIHVVIKGGLCRWLVVVVFLRHKDSGIVICCLYVFHFSFKLISACVIFKKCDLHFMAIQKPCWFGYH